MRWHWQSDSPQSGGKDYSPLSQLGHAVIRSIEYITSDGIPHFGEDFFNLLCDAATQAVMIMTEKLRDILDHYYFWIQYRSDFKKTKHKVISWILIEFIITSKFDDFRIFPPFCSPHLRKTLARWPTQQAIKLSPGFFGNDFTDS
jgi:hypothetical protein